MQVTVQREIGSLLDVPALIRWFETSPAPRWILLGIVSVGVVSTLGRRSGSGNSSSAGGLALLIWLALLLGGAWWLWRAIG